MPTPTFHDRTATLDGTPDHLAELGTLLGARTRVAVLAALVRSPTPLNINEVARRVGVDASPVRTHLELLLHAGLVREVGGAPGRERRFTTRVTNVRLTLEGVDRPPAPDKAATPSKAVLRLQKKLAAAEKDAQKATDRARKLALELDEAWAKAR